MVVSTNTLPYVKTHELRQILDRLEKDREELITYVFNGQNRLRALKREIGIAKSELQKRNDK